MTMAGQIQIWMEELERVLEARSGTAWTVTHEVTEPRPVPLFLTSIVLAGPTAGELCMAIPGEDLVQLVQTAAQQAANAHAPLDEALLGTWRALLEETLNAFLARLHSEGTGEYHAELGALRAATAEEFETAEGTELEPAQAYTLRSGEMALSLRLRVVQAAAQADIAADVATNAGVAAPDTEPATQPEMAAAAPADEAASASTAQSAAQAADKAEAEAERRARQAEADRAAAEAMERAAAEAEERNAWRRTDASMDESSPFRTHPERLNLLLDIELEATLRFGALEMPLRKVLELGPGDVLQLDRHVQEPVDLVVGDRIVARGEVVLVGGNFGLHVTEVAEPKRRLDSIRALF